MRGTCLVACIVGLAGLAGCATTDAGPGGATPSPSVSVTGSPADPAATTPASDPAPTTSSGQPEISQPAPTLPTGSEVTVTGTIQTGVESGCLVLEGYQLIGGDPAVIAAGRRVTVTGRVDPDIVSYCQQGESLVVISARPA